MVPRKQHVASFTASVFPTFCLQVRSLTSARCVEKPLVRAPTSSPTVGSTQASSPLAVTCVAKASNERWIYGGTGRRSTAWSESKLQCGKRLQHYENRSQASLLDPSPVLNTDPGITFLNRSLKRKEEDRGQSRVLTAQPEWLWKGKVKAGVSLLLFPSLFLK